MSEVTKCGFVAIVGRPNVGKSTLLNHLLGKKMSITSRKPQTTRMRLLGIKTDQLVQTIYVDTPGIHSDQKRALNQYMNQEARLSLPGVDVIVLVTSELSWRLEDEAILTLFKNTKAPVILAVNKVDKCPDKKALLPYLKTLEPKYPFAEIVPISALSGVNLELLEAEIHKRLPENPHFFPNGEETDKSLYFRMAEIIREKITRAFGQELPYTCAVEIESYQSKQDIPFISAIIWVERDGQKAILIGKQGERLKKIGMRARVDIEKLLGKQVHLKLWVKVKKGWSDNQKILHSLGYIDFSDE